MAKKKDEWLAKIAGLLQPNVFTSESPLWVSTFEWLEKAPEKHLANLAMLIDCRRDKEQKEIGVVVTEDGETV